MVSPEVAGSCAVICMASTFCKLRFGVWPAAVALRLNISIAGALKRGSGQTKDLTCAYLYRLNPSSPDRFKEGDWMRFHLLKGQSTKPWQFCFRSDRLVIWSWAKKHLKPLKLIYHRIQKHLTTHWGQKTRVEECCSLSVDWNKQIIFRDMHVPEAMFRTCQRMARAWMARGCRDRPINIQWILALKRPEAVCDSDMFRTTDRPWTSKYIRIIRWQMISNKMETTWPKLASILFTASSYACYACSGCTCPNLSRRWTGFGHHTRRWRAGLCTCLNMKAYDRNIVYHMITTTSRFEINHSRALVWGVGWLLKISWLVGCLVGWG